MQINEQDKTTFVLEEQGWSKAEISRYLGIKRAALDTRISRARKAIQARSTS